MTQALSIRRAEPETSIVRQNDFMPAMTIEDAVERRNMIVAFTKSVMREGVDFGTIPGTDKPTLLKAGAEKLCTLFGLTPRPVMIEKVEDWTGRDHGGEAFFYYHYQIQLLRGDMIVAAAEGSSNSWEKKHRYRWVPESELPAGADKTRLRTRSGNISEFAFAIDKGETSGKYGKPAAYWERFRAAIKNGTARRVMKPTRNGESPAYEIGDTLYRIPNEDVADVVNSLQKMAQKRALVAASLLAVNASEFFTQDVEDMDMIDAAYTSADVKTTPAAPPPHSGSEEGDADFRDQWIKAIEARGGTEEQADQILFGLLRQRKKSLSDLNGSARMNLLSMASEGRYDAYLRRPSNDDQSADIDPASAQSESPAIEPSGMESESPSSSSAPSPHEQFWIQVHEAAACAGLVDEKALKNGVKKWALKFGVVGQEHKAPAEEIQKLLKAIGERSDYFA